MTLYVPHIYSKIEIATELAINLRQPVGSELSFVSFIEDTNETLVHIDTWGFAMGEQVQVTLESFNTLSTIQSTLKTDVITVTIS